MCQDPNFLQDTEQSCSTDRDKWFYGIREVLWQLCAKPVLQTRSMGCFPRLLFVLINITGITMVDRNIQGLGNLTDIHRTANCQRNPKGEKGMEEFFVCALQALFLCVLCDISVLLQ